MSLVVPAYNDEKYLSEMLRSALAQTVPFGQITVVDDGSQHDLTRLIASDFPASPIYCIRQDNAGLGPARNTGISLSKCEYILFCDADDVLSDELLATFSETLESHPEIDLFCFSADVFSDENHPLGNTSRYHRMADMYFQTGKDALLDMLRRREFISSSCLYIMRRSVLEGRIPLRFQAMKHEDEPFTLQALLRSKGTVFTRKTLYHRRMRSGSIMTSAPDSTSVEGYFRAAQAWRATSIEFEASDSRLIRRHADSLYTRGIERAIKAGLDEPDIRSMARRFSPAYFPAMNRDLSLSRASPRLVAAFYQLTDLCRRLL
ncbi:glycosyltransferase family A protein [Cognatiluteimonas weifangensis]|uniref:glycosyltransferase family A protein n=1 Tax=Cognatiluteimonas weifangensis TaxID=2303539 RepID=UPI0013148EA7|nr:glycosyltransferase family A protein [Luteimonas weifangensis]